MTLTSRRILAFGLAIIMLASIFSLLQLRNAASAEASTFTFVTATKQMGRDYCWNLYRGVVVKFTYIGRGYWEATCVGRVME